MELRVKKLENQQEEIQIKDLQKMINKNKIKQFKKESKNNLKWGIIGIITMAIEIPVLFHLANILFK